MKPEGGDGGGKPLHVVLGVGGGAAALMQLQSTELVEGHLWRGHKPMS